MQSKEQAQRLSTKINTYWQRFGIEAKAEPVQNYCRAGGMNNWVVRSALVLHVRGGIVVGSPKELRGK